jgi:hypothetical protein
MWSGRGCIRTRHGIITKQTFFKTQIKALRKLMDRL